MFLSASLFFYFPLRGFILYLTLIILNTLPVSSSRNAERKTVQLSATGDFWRYC